MVLILLLFILKMIFDHLKKNNLLLCLFSHNAHFSLVIIVFTIICNDAEECFRLSCLLKHTSRGRFQLCCLLLIEQGILSEPLLGSESIFHCFYLRLGISNEICHPLELYRLLQF